MDRLLLPISGLTGTAGRLGGIAAQILQDRLELLSLELREAKILFAQTLLLACMGVVFSFLGLLLLVLSGVYFMAPEWRLYALTVASGGSLLVGGTVFIALYRRFGRKSLFFGQSLDQLKKDMACFSTKN
ncbi:MAG: phage holin family protein [Desulfobacteraceae bacterium]|nr:MAG: phage holin family protein [Desulfobacteraceae bacterium]